MSWQVLYLICCARSCAQHIQEDRTLFQQVRGTRRKRKRAEEKSEKAAEAAVDQEGRTEGTTT